MSGASVTWSKIMRSVERGTVLHGAFSQPKPFVAKFTVTRPVARGVYVEVNGERTFLPWPAARHVKVIDSRTWVVDDLGAGRTAWTIQP